MTSKYIDKYKELTAYQKHIIKEDGTEMPFSGIYYDNFKPGLYVDLLSDEVLFLSDDKYDSGSGWPSFTRPASDDAVVLIECVDRDYNYWEVRSKLGDCHLGHMFEDGPVEDGGKRYCINSNALKFIPYKDLEKYGLEDWKDKIKKNKE